MLQYTAAEAVRTNRLRDAYGDEIVLSEDGKEGSSVHKIVVEFDIHGKSYVVLRPEDAGSDDEETLVFRVTSQANGEYEIETIEDDEEWENVSELADEMTFPDSE